MGKKFTTFNIRPRLQNLGCHYFDLAPCIKLQIPAGNDLVIVEHAYFVGNAYTLLRRTVFWLKI